MGWKDQLDKAVAAVRDAAECEQARGIAAKTWATAATLAQKAKGGAVSVADAFLEVNRVHTPKRAIECSVSK